MNLFGLFSRRGGTAPVARERLQILLAHERKTTRDTDLVAALQKDVLAAISKHIEIDPEKVQVKMHRRDEMSMLEIDIEIGDGAVKDEAVSEDKAAA